MVKQVMSNVTSYPTTLLNGPNTVCLASMAES